MAVEEIENKIPIAIDTILQTNSDAKLMKSKIIDFMERRWRGTFHLIGKLLSKKV